MVLAFKSIFKWFRPLNKSIFKWFEIDFKMIFKYCFSFFKTERPRVGGAFPVGLNRKG